MGTVPTILVKPKGGVGTHVARLTGRTAAQMSKKTVSFSPCTRMSKR